MMTLYGHPGGGSVLIEAQRVCYDLPFRFEDVGDLFTSAEARASLAAINPVAQVPTLVLDDGRVMSESAAITLYLADLTGRDDRVPGPHEPERAAFLRWLVFLVTNIYPTFTHADDPQRFVADATAARAFRARVDAYAAALWRRVEPAAAGPWFLGERPSALDLYVCVMTRWRPVVPGSPRPLRRCTRSRRPSTPILDTPTCWHATSRRGVRSTGHRAKAATLRRTRRAIGTPRRSSPPRQMRTR